MSITYNTKVWKAGNSKVVTIDKFDCEAECLEDGTMVRVTIEKVNADCKQKAEVSE